MKAKSAFVETLRDEDLPSSGTEVPSELPVSGVPLYVPSFEADPPPSIFEDTATTSVSPPRITDIRAVLGPHAATGRTKPWVGRAFSIVALGLLVGALSFGAEAAYRGATDSFVAPVILSPDSDIVIQSKAAMTRLLVDRRALVGRMEEATAAAEAAEKTAARLHQLEEETGNALQWYEEVSSRTVAASTGKMSALSARELLLGDMLEAADHEALEVHKNVEAGLLGRDAEEHSVESKDTLQLALLDNKRDLMSVKAELDGVRLSRGALAAAGSKVGLKSPEVLALAEQKARVEVEILKAEAEVRGKRAQMRADEEDLASIDEVITEMRARPVQRAAEGLQTYAFVPYSQLPGVNAGAQIHQCKVFGIFRCVAVGQVTEVVPGEVASQDPWGATMRGQYALLALTDPLAAQSRSLRIRGAIARGAGAATVATSAQGATALSVATDQLSTRNRGL